MWSHPNQASLDQPPCCPRIFSGNVVMIKREPGIFALALESMHTLPQDVTFIDDRSENVLAAHTAGMRATLFTSSSQLKDPTAHVTVPEDVG